MHAYRFLSGFVVVALVLYCLPRATVAQCTGPCGDLDNSGGATTLDIMLLANWLHLYQQPPGALACGDVDGLQGITERDILWFWGYIHGGGPLFCPPFGPPYTPLANDDYAIVHNTVFPAGSSSVVLRVGMINRAVLECCIFGLSAPLEIRVDDEIPEVSNLIFSPDAYSKWSHVRGSVDPTGTAEGQVLMGLETTFKPDVPVGRHAIARVKLTLPPSAVDRQITVGWCDVPAGNVPSIGFMATYALNVEPCVAELIGDTNDDGVITSADIIRLVIYVFKGGPAPVPVPLAGDANCDNTLTSADIIHLVGFVFKGGEPPCDVCAP